jgi:glutathione-regulated potassium-efflux system ancillary protein KefC
MENAPAWLSYSLIYLAAAVIAVPLFKALGLGTVMGYLAAGMAIGPWGLKLVSNVDDLLHFAEFGVVLMLFLIGLELEPRRLWSLRRPIFGWGTAQVLACAVVMTGVALLFGVRWKVALAASLGLALSSTAIALQAFSERNLLRTPSGEAGFSILLFQDVAAIPILALVPLLGTVSERADSNLLVEGLRVAGAIFAIIVGGRLLLRPLLRWIARSRTPEIFTATALLLVVGISALMLALDLSMALGAFLAGVLLAESEFRRELETDIEPFKGLLLGLFFMAVGMNIDFAVLLGSPGKVAAILAGFLLIKLVVIAALSRAMGLPVHERPVFTLLLAQGGEFAFVVFQTAVGARVFPEKTSSLLVGAVTLSMLLGPLLLLLVDRFVLPRFGRNTGPAPEEISEPQEAPVLIAGFGRYGQIVGRTLSAQGIRATVLDHDAELIAQTRRFGFRVFYGDATRLDLLRTAGAAQARVLVVAVDDPEQSLAIVDLARQHFPQLQIVARARNVTHWYALRDRDVTLVQREIFESSLASARSVMELLGQSPQAALHAAERFRAHNLSLMEKMYPHHKDEAKLIAIARQGRQQLREQMALERAELAAQAADSTAGRQGGLSNPVSDQK